MEDLLWKYTVMELVIKLCGFILFTITTISSISALSIYKSPSWLDTRLHTGYIGSLLRTPLLQLFLSQCALLPCCPINCLPTQTWSEPDTQLCQAKQHYQYYNNKSRLCKTHHQAADCEPMKLVEFHITVLYLQRKNKSEYEDNTTLNSNVHMARKFPYVNNNLFSIWLQRSLPPKETTMRSTAFWDRHSIRSSFEATEFAVRTITTLCLPSNIPLHTQPLDRSFFRLLKTHYKAARRWMCSNTE
jgi:hypothetical protein